MKSLTLNEVAAFSAGHLSGGDAAALCKRVVTDSRLAGPGDLFVALKGERFDAHDFLTQVASQGATAVLVSQQPSAPLPCAVILVEDTLLGLQRLAASYRQLLAPQIVGITGSNGKTSTKDLLSTVLRKKFQVTATLGNLNNHIGVPLTLLSMNEADTCGVVEMGMNHFGEIQVLADIAKPDAAVITNIGVAHIEYMGSREGIAKEKGMLVEAITEKGVVVLNANDDMTPSLAARTRAKVITAGIDAGDVRATILGADASGTRFSLDFAGEATLEGVLPLVGRHMVGNAVLAAACAWHYGISPTDIVEALTSVQLTKGRLQVKQVQGITFLDDSYNANPDSMRAGLKTLAELSLPGRRVAVLGRMGELGPHAESGHREVGEYAADAGMNLVVTVGNAEAESIGQAATKRKPILEHHHFSTHAEAATFLGDWLKDDDAVLLKGSRSAGMEQVLTLFEKR